LRILSISFIKAALMKEVNLTMKKLYVGNLPFDYDSQKLEELFAKFGSVSSAFLIKDRETGKSKGFGFVEIDNEGAKKAMEELNNKEIGGRALKVNEARPMENNDRQFRR
jgi:cold-inducible RNA-binding protein